MSFFQNKPAGTSAFGTPSTQNTNTFGAFSTPQTQKQGPFSLAGFGSNASAQNTTNAFGTPTQQQNTAPAAFGASTNAASGFGGNTGTGFGGQSALQSGFGGSTGFGGGMFGQQQQQQTNQSGFGGGLFGQQQQQPQQTGFGGSTFGGLGGSNVGGSFGNFGGNSWIGQQQQQQQQQQPQQSQITPITRWSDLPPTEQKFLEDLEKYISEQVKITEDLKTRSPQLNEYVLSIPTDVTEVQKRFDTISHILSIDTTILTHDLKQKFDILSTQTQQTIRLLEVLIHPSASSLSYLASTHGAGGDSLIDFFLIKTGEWQIKVEIFKREIAEIDRMLKAVEEGQMSGMGSASDEILETIRAQWEGFCGLAARVGKLRERAGEVKIMVERGLRGGRV